jgi:hypothetical protein
MVVHLVDDFVGKQVELLLLFTVAVMAVYCAKNARQPRAGCLTGDELGSQRNVVQQAGQFPCCSRVLLLLVKNVSLNGRDGCVNGTAP